MTPEELEDLKAQVADEETRIWSETYAPGEVDGTVSMWHHVHGFRDGDPWTEPQTAVEDYPVGAIVTHNGGTWLNLRSCNSTEPPGRGWRREDARAAPRQPDPWDADTVYAQGDEVMYRGRAWRASESAPAGEPHLQGISWYEIDWRTGRRDSHAVDEGVWDATNDPGAP